MEGKKSNKKERMKKIKIKEKNLKWKRGEKIK